MDANRAGAPPLGKWGGAGPDGADRPDPPPRPDRAAAPPDPVGEGVPAAGRRVLDLLEHHRACELPFAR
ncbi:hypothetical protein ACFVZS_13145, partial [Streptomyces abikoensis]